MSGPTIGSLAVLLAPPLVQIEAVVLQFKECNTDHQLLVQLRVAILE